ncbi:MAG: tyrosine-type recombinase/integrase [Actinomycetota bacterium]|nr:tyrosine-type recombinase/integrase [Actinomycetota bacterium]
MDVVRRDAERLVVAAVGSIVAVGDPWCGFRLVDPVGGEVDEVTAFLRDLRARDASPTSLRSYGLALLRWYRFLWAVEVAWDRAGRAEARDFMLWLASARKPARGSSGHGVPGSVNRITRKPSAGVFYAARTRRHNRSVVRSFYEFHRFEGRGPLLNPMPERHGRNGERPDAHHNPLEPFSPGRRADFQPKLAKRLPPNIGDADFDALFAAMGSDRDRAILAFYISTGARAAELLGVTCDRVDIGQQLIGVHRKGSGALQWLPASPDAFVWLQLYRQGVPGRSWVGTAPLWLTLRRPYRPLNYAAMRAVLGRANASLGTNWTLHDLRHTAAHRMVADPRLSLVDVQWVLGHAHITTTQLYTEPSADDVIARMHEHHRRAGTNEQRVRVPAAGYRPEVLETLLGRVP